MPVFNEFIAAGLANAITSTIVHPMDVTKTIMQANVQSKMSGSSVQGALGTVMMIREKHGIFGFWKLGWQASMIRELKSSGIRAGLYPSIRKKINSIMEEGLVNKILAVLTSGTLGACLANPIDVTKVKLMTMSDKYNLNHRLLYVLKNSNSCVHYRMIGVHCNNT